MTHQKTIDANDLLTKLRDWLTAHPGRQVTFKYEPNGIYAIIWSGKLAEQYYPPQGSKWGYRVEDFGDLLTALIGERHDSSRDD